MCFDQFGLQCALINFDYNVLSVELYKDNTQIQAAMKLAQAAVVEVNMTDSLPTSPHYYLVI